MIPLARTLQTRDRILHSARHILAQHGAHSCSIRAVAQRAAVTPGAIYRHFRDKDALLARVVELAFQRFETSLLEAIVSLPVGSFARIAALGEAYLRFARDNEEEFKILFSPHVATRKRISQIPGRAGYPILRRCIVEAIEAGNVREADPDLIAFYLWSRVHGIVMLLLACDLHDELGVEEASTLHLFQLTRPFVIHGLERHD